MTTSHVLLWTCDSCKLPILEGDGYVHISMTSVQRSFDALRRKERAFGDSDNVIVLVSPSEIMVDSSAHWQAHHADCDPAPDSIDYSINVEEIDHTSKVLMRTVHLSEKNWFRATDWMSSIATHAAMTPLPVAGI